MSQWQPIETAPMDGTHIIGYIPVKSNRGGVVGIFFEPEYQRKFLGIDIPHGGLWRYSCHEQVIAEPTHWMSLPNPPDA